MRLAFMAYAGHAFTDNVLISTPACVMFAFVDGGIRARDAGGRSKARMALPDSGCGVGNGASQPELVSMRAPFCLLSAGAAGIVVALPGRPASGIAFVVNSGGASISVIDMATQKEVRRIPALREPHHVALSPDGTACWSATPPATR